MPKLTWQGKEQVLHHHLDVPFHLLKKQYDFVADDNKPTNRTDNILIHGDNLTALKSLLPEFGGRVNCIYIDPPYNTGNENWVYNDNVNDPRIQKWLGEVVGKEGEDFSRHDKWLCMIYPRLKLLKELLADNGVIFISIDFANEEAYLKCICDEIFGRSNFIGEFTWESTTQPINSGSARFGLQQKSEAILFYAKNKTNLNQFILKEVESGLHYPHEGQLGKCRFEIIEKSDAGEYQRDTMKFPILGLYPREGKRWQIGLDTANELLKNNRLEIVDELVKRAFYPEDEIDKRKFQPFWSHLPASQFGTAQSGKELLNTIMGRAVGFDTVKPVELITELLSYFDKNALILDSFMGSGTTAHAVLSLNQQDGGNRRFIGIEMMDYAETITAERIRRVINGYGTKAETQGGTGGGFSFYTVGEPLFYGDNLNPTAPITAIREYIGYTEGMDEIWHTDNGVSPHALGVANGTAYVFYYLQNQVTTLDLAFLQSLSPKGFVQRPESWVIYADKVALSPEQLKQYHIVFKRIPRDISKF